MKKTPTIFLRSSDMKSLTTEVNPLCEWVFKGEGVATRKYDGACCKIEDGKYWKRREIKKGKNKPDDYVEEQFDEKTGKSFGWVPVIEDSKADKWFIEGKENCESQLTNGTYELVGPKVQGNAENLDKHTLIKHSEAEKLEVDRAKIKEYLLSHDYEGIVFHHPDGRMAKIKKRDYL